VITFSSIEKVAIFFCVFFLFRVCAEIELRETALDGSDRPAEIAEIAGRGGGRAADALIVRRRGRRIRPTLTYAERSSLRHVTQTQTETQTQGFPLSAVHIIMPSSGLLLSNGSANGNGSSRMDGTLSQSMDSVNTVAAEEEVSLIPLTFIQLHFKKN